MSKILANEIANYGDDAPIDLKEGLNIPAGKPIQAAGSTGTTGQVLSTTGTSIQWVTPFSGSYTDLTNKPTIPSAQVNADWNSSSGVSAILNKPVVPPLSSVVTASAGTAALSFNSANGQFTYTPPDLSSFATTTSLTTAVANSSNWDTAYGWGDHAQAGYLTAEVDTIQDVVQRSYYDRSWFGGTFPNSWSPGGYPVFNTTTFTNEIYHHGFGDSIHIGSNTAGVRWLDYDFAGDFVDAGKNPQKIIGYNYYIADETVDSFRGGGSAANGINQLANVLHHDVQPDADGNVTTYSIGNDAGIIRLGNRSGTSPYLEASSTGTKLFNNGALKLKTVSNGIEVTGRTYYNNSFASSDLDVTLATSWPSMFVVASDTNKPYVSFNNQWNELLLSSSSIDGLADVDTTTVAPQNGQVLKWNGAKWAPANDLTGGGGGGLALTDLSASTATASGGGAFAYNNGTGVFTYTPPDLSNYDTAYGWSDHSTEGYITSIGDAIQDADFTTNGLMKRTAAGTYTSTTDNSSNWDTAFGWGDHGSQGYLTSLPAHGIGNHSDVTVTSPQNNQLLKYNTSLAQWENWTANYLTSESDTLASVTGRGASTSTELTFNGIINCEEIKLADDKVIKFGTDNDVSIGYFNTSDKTYFTSTASELYISSDNVELNASNHTNKYFKASSTNTIIYHNNSPRITTSASGMDIGGTITTNNTVTASSFIKSGGTSSQYLMADGSVTTGGGNTQVSISDTIPAGSASAGDLWWESDTGRLKIYYQDVDSAQWVDVNAPLRQDRIASTGAPSSATDTGVAGDIRYDSGYVYIAVGTNTWKRAALTTW